MSAWRERCPYGHASVDKYRDTKRYRCYSCGHTYDGEPYDAKEVNGFPVADPPDPVPFLDDEELLEAIVEVTDDPARTWVRAAEISTLPGRAGNRLNQLRDDGLVRRRETSEVLGHLWQPTEKGIARVRGEQAVTDGGAAVPMVRERNGGVETVRGPEPVAYQAWERDRGQVTVLAKVVLFVIVSFLLVFAIAAFNGVMP